MNTAILQSLKKLSKRVINGPIKTEKEKQPDIYFLTELYHATYKVFLEKKIKPESDQNCRSNWKYTGSSKAEELVKNYNGNGIRNIQTVENSKGKMT